MDTVREKFSHPMKTASGETRAWVSPTELKTLWFNTGTICNLECENCYIESSPKNDRLSFINGSDVEPYLSEIDQLGWGKAEIGFTGGEPFANPHMLEVLELCLKRNFPCLVLTNATQPLWRNREQVQNLSQQFPRLLQIRVSLDHYTQEIHEQERGANSWKWVVKGLQWLVENNFDLSIAGRSLSGETKDAYLEGYAELFQQIGLPLDAQNPKDLTVFAEMDEQKDVPEITTQCWDILKLDPKNIMCASSRMVVKDKGENQTRVAACTLLPYDPQFSMGETLEKSWRDIRLNHKYCAQFCVLGGSSCSQ